MAFDELEDDVEGVKPNDVSLNKEIVPDDISLDELDVLNQEWQAQQAEEKRKNLLEAGAGQGEEFVKSAAVNVGVPAAMGALGGVAGEGFAVARNLGTLGKWISSFAGNTAGEGLGLTMTDPRGFGALEDFTSRNPLRNPLARNAGLALFLKGGHSLARYLRPDTEKVAFDAAKQSGVIPAKVGAYNSDVERRALAPAMEKGEDAFVSSPVMDAVDDSAEQPLKQLVNVGDKRMDELFIKRNAILQDSDKAIPPASMGNVEQFTKDRIDNLRASGKNVYVNEDALVEARKYLNENNLYNLNSQQLQEQIDRIDSLAQPKGVFDTAKKAAAEKGRKSADTIAADTQGLLYLRDYFADELNKRTGGAGAVKVINDEIAALTSYKPAITNARREIGSEMSDVTTASPMGSAKGWFETTKDFVTGGEKAARTRKLAAALRKDRELFDQLKQQRDIKLGRLEPSKRLKIEQSLTRPSSIMAGGQGINAMLNPDSASAQEFDPTQTAPDPYANGLPRESERFGLPEIQRLAQNMTQAAAVDPNQTNKLIIAKQLGIKLAEAERSGDFKKKQRIVADLAKLAPEHFSPGRGIDNKLFHPDDQQEYMEELERAHRNGKVGSIFLAKQRDAFLDKNDGTILDVEPEMAKRIVPKQRPSKPSGQFPRPREYAY